MTQPKEEVTMKEKSLDIHCARCGGVKGCPGIYHPAERAKLEALFQQKLENLDNLIRVTDPPDLEGLPPERAWMAGQMSIIMQVKEFMYKIGGRK